MHTDNRKGSVGAEAVSVGTSALHSGMFLSTCGGIGVVEVEAFNHLQKFLLWIVRSFNLYNFWPFPLGSPLVSMLATQPFLS